MKSLRLLLLTLLLGLVPAGALDLPATAVFSKGPNEFKGEVLEITKGRGANLGWYIQAREEEEVTLSIEFSNAKPLNQLYQISFDGADAFWEVPVTGDPEWTTAPVGTFRLRAGVPALVMLVPPSNRKYDHPVLFRKLIVKGAKPDNLALASIPEASPTPASKPGFGQKLSGLHPALTSRDLRPPGEIWRVTGMAQRNAKEVLFTTWEGDLFQVDLTAMAKGGDLSYRRLARGLSEPMGLAVWGERLFVTEKNEVTELIDEDADGQFETYRCVAHGWPCTLDYHEYLFGAVIQPPHLYFCSSVAMAIRNHDNRQAPLRGSVVKVHLETGETEIVAGGLRTPNGIGEGPGGGIFITDNQGEWLPGNKLIHLQPDAFYHFRSQPPWHPFDRPVSTPPAVWLPQGEIAASPTQPVLLPKSWEPYAGQLIFGDATFGGLQRAFVEHVDGVIQGAVFPFSQGFQHLFNRFVLAEDGTLYGGGVARGNDWKFIERVSGLTEIRYTGAPVFETLAVRARANGLELEFTQPLAPGWGWDPSAYYVTQWGYQATQSYGGAKVRHRRAEVRSASVLEDRRRVFLELPGLIVGEVIHIRLPEVFESEGGQRLWTGDAWYTLNRLPNIAGKILPRPEKVIAASEPWFRFQGSDPGQTLYQNFCAACHSLDGSPLPGPTFHHLLGSRRTVRDPETGEKKEVVADEAYLRQSILDPNSLLVEGYQENVMPPLGAFLTGEQVDALVRYVMKASAR